MHQIGPGRARPDQLRVLRLPAVAEVGLLERVDGALLDLGEDLLERRDGGPVELVQWVELAQRAQVDTLADLVQLGQVLGPEPVEVEERDRPGRVRQHVLVDLAGLLRGAFEQHDRGHLGGEQALAALGQGDALLLDHDAVAPGVAVDLEVDGLGDALRRARSPSRTVLVVRWRRPCPSGAARASASARPP